MGRAGKPPGGRAEPGGAAQQAGSEVDPGTGLPRWIERPQGQGGVTWSDILECWGLIEADMHERYGIDLDEPGLLEGRTVRWLKVRILGLLGCESRLSTALAPPEKGGPP